MQPDLGNIICQQKLMPHGEVYNGGLFRLIGGCDFAQTTDRTMLQSYFIMYTIY